MPRVMHEVDYAAMEWEDGIGWYNAEIKPYGALLMDPSAMVLHYAQMAFEGLKAYRNLSGKNMLFRPRENFKRMNITAKRMCIPKINEEEVLDVLKQLLRLDEAWVPNELGTSLYIRPTIVATDLLFIVIVSFSISLVCSPCDYYED